ncbi:hypothetical protein [Chryseobacterium lathyri]|nr:hypothetical protein [Chryseobacterium lathyri]
MGLVLPTNPDPNNIINPQGGAVAIGTIMYDSTNNCIKYYKPTGWSNCLCDSCPVVSNPHVSSLDCASGALTGYYRENLPSGGTKVINYTGGNGESYNAFSITSTGVTGLTAIGSSGTLANGNGSFTLDISGTPSGPGLANFLLNFGGQICTFNVNVTTVNTNCTASEELGVNVSTNPASPTVLTIGGETVSVYRVTAGTMPNQTASASGFPPPQAMSGVSMNNASAYFILGNGVYKHVTSMKLVFSKPVNNMGFKTNWYANTDSSQLSAKDINGNPVTLTMYKVIGNTSVLSYNSSGNNLTVTGQASSGNTGSIGYIISSPTPYTEITITSPTSYDDILAAFTYCNAYVAP